MSKLFRICIEGSVDSDGDGSPDVTVDVDAFGFDVLRIKQNLDAGQALSLFSSVVDPIRKFFGK